MIACMPLGAGAALRRFEVDDGVAAGLAVDDRRARDGGRPAARMASSEAPQLRAARIIRPWPGRVLAEPAARAAAA